jgi:hypothetical protein
VSVTVMGIGGIRSFSSGSLFGSRHQSVYGFSGAPIPPGAPFGLEAGGFWSDDSEGVGSVTGDVHIREAFIGVWRPIETGGSLRPYVGIGGTGIHAEGKSSLGTEHDDSAGMYLHGGLFLDLGSHVVLALDLRTVFLTHLELGGASGDGDYTQLAIGVGARF